jgi:putative peptidoglycan lipid II flippase
MIFKNSLVLAFFSALSLIIAILRDRLLATHVGIGHTLDVYNAAFRVPDLLYGSLLAFVTAGTVVPFLTKENSHGDILDPRQKLYSLTLFFGGLICIVSVVLGLFLPFYAKYVVPGFTTEQLAEYIHATRLLLIQPFLLGVSSLIACFAQIRNEFILYGVAPLGYSIMIVYGIVFLYPTHGLDGLLYGVLLGSLVSLVIQGISLRNAHFRDFVHRFRFSHVKELVRVAIPRSGTNITTQLRVIFLTGLATTFGAGGLSSYLFAQRIYDAATQLIQQSVTTASLPVLSKEFLDGEKSKYKATVHKYVSLLFLTGVIISYVVYLFEDSIVELLYGVTGYNHVIIFFLNTYLIMLPLTMVSGYLSVSLYAMKDTKSVFVAFFIASIGTVFVGNLLRDKGQIALSAALLTWAVGQFLLLVLFYSRKKYM